MKKLGLIILVVVIALGAMGAGYALWSQTLTVASNVDVATFDVNFTSTNILPTPPTNGTVEASIIDTKNAVLTVTNAYPGYSGVFTLTITNQGSIPVTLALTEGVGDTENMFVASANPSAAIPAGGTFAYTVTVTVPDWTGTTKADTTVNTASDFSANYTIIASQSTP